LQVAEADQTTEILAAHIETVAKVVQLLILAEPVSLAAVAVQARTVVPLLDKAVVPTAGKAVAAKATAATRLPVEAVAVIGVTAVPAALQLDQTYHLRLVALVVVVALVEADTAVLPIEAIQAEVEVEDIEEVTAAQLQALPRAAALVMYEVMHG
jgi:hypothetical protein